MSRQLEELGGITLLGSQKTHYPDQYAPGILEVFDNKHPGNDYFVKFVCPEFTSLCPISGQPDFATIHIRYIPGSENGGKQIIETVSVQLPKSRRLS